MPLSATPHNAGFTSFQVRDEDGLIPSALWYPSDQRAHTFKQGAYDFHVAKKAALRPGPHPLVMLSHGSGGTRFGHCKTAEFLAENGFMVCAPEHPGNNFFDESQTGSARSYANRSRHMKATLDGLLKSEFADYIDPERIAIMGFSLGGYTALTCLGVVPNVASLREHIRQNREFDPVFTSYRVIIKDGYDGDTLPITADPRYKCAILLAPVSGGLFDPENLKDITCPVLLYRAEKDTMLRNPFHAEYIRDALPSQPDYHVLKNASHFSFLSPIRAEFKEQAGDMAFDLPGFDREREHLRLNEEIRDFLEKIFLM